MKKLFLILFSLSNIITSIAQFGEQQKLTNQIASISSAVLSDMDGDGDQDFVVSGYGGWTFGGIFWYENLGDTLFGAHHLVFENYFGESIESFDVDEDGDNDVVAVTDSRVYWYENVGEGVFGERHTIATGLEEGRSICTIDLDGDGDLDVLSASYYDDKIAWSENLEGGAFGPQQVITYSANGAMWVSASDIDGDGDNDVLSASEWDDKIAWYENLGDGDFSDPIIISDDINYASYVFSEDLDSDGDNDVLSSSFVDDEIYWHENLGGGTFGSPILISDLVDGPNIVQAADFDEDGDNDIVSISKWDSKLAWYENLGGGVFGEQIEIEGGSGSDYLEIGDINGDGALDALIQGFAILDDGTAAFDEFMYININQTPNANDVFVADIDNDGDNDVIMSSYEEGGRISWVENIGEGNFNLAQKNISIDGDFINPESIFIVDIDFDGDNDVLVGSGDKVSFYINDGDGNFGLQQILDESSGGAYSVFACDLDSDGDIDVLATSYAEDKVIWYENTGGLSFTEEQIVVIGMDGANWVRAKDLNGDGNIDVLSSSWFDSNIAWCENMGDGTFGDKQFLDEEYGGVHSVYAIDMDNDGLNDVLVGGGYYQKVSWFKNLGEGVFGEKQPIITLETGPIDIGNIYPVDIDLDGDLDIITADDLTDEVAWIENYGDGTFSDENTISLEERGAESVFAGDVNGDGDPEIFAASSYYGSVVWFENFNVFKTQVKGRTFFDINENGIHDSLDIGFDGIAIFSTPESDYVYTSADGNYFMNFSDTIGSYVLEPEIPEYWSIITDSLSYEFEIDSSSFFLDSLDFGLFPDTIVEFITPNIVGGFPRCNTLINYWLNVQNDGTTIPSGVIHLILDDSITYFASEIAPDSIVGQNVYWSFDSLFYFSHEVFNLEVQMPDFMSMGDTLCSMMNVYTIDETGELSEALYMDTLCEILLCAYDPNDKIVNPLGIDSLGYISPFTNELEYTVRFQNTGTDTAINVIIKDQLDPNLDWGSFTPLAWSHDMAVEVDHTGEVIFSFYDIMLPDSNVNQLESQGFVKYKIELNDVLPNPTIIRNDASIFFDANPPVNTNNTINTIYNCETIFDEAALPNIGCENEIITIGLNDEFSNTTYNWYIDGVDSAHTSMFNWFADTSGIFEISCSLTNDYCSSDTSFSIEIFPEIPITELTAINLCDGDSILIFDSYRFMEDVYFDTTYSINGCDSILSQPLHVIEDLDSILTPISICIGDSILIFEAYQNSPDLYFDTLASIYGCDSIIFQELFVNELPDVEFTLLDNDTLCEGSSNVILAATPDGGLFYGIGVVDNEFSSSIAGEGEHLIYYNYEDDNGCSKTDSIQITVIGCLGLRKDFQNKITVFPNPFDDLTTINFGKYLTGKHTIIINNILGQEVYRNDNVTGTNLEIKKVELGVGIYILTLFNSDSEELYSTKLLVE